MTKSRWLRFFVLKSLLQRRGRFVIATASVMLTVAVLSALVVLSTGIRDKIGRELQSYGANMIITTERGLPIGEETIKEITAMPQVLNHKRHIYGQLKTEMGTVEVTGMKKEAFSGARLEGRFPEAEGEIMIGKRLSETLEIKQGDTLKDLTGKGEFRVVGVFEKGSEEDSIAVIPLRVAQEVFRIKGASSLLLNVDARYLSSLKKTIEQRFKGLRVRTIRQIALAEERLLGKIELLMAVVSLVVLFSAVVTLGSTVGANIIERMEEIGLMKALGARASEVARFFLSEAVLFGIGGSLLGYPLGVGVAEIVSRSAFKSYVTVNLLWFPLLVVVGLVVSVSATYM
ncbi:MAG: ABC transporter permease, partial [Nitrospirae bacterium]